MARKRYSTEEIIRKLREAVTRSPSLGHPAGGFSGF